MTKKTYTYHNNSRVARYFAEKRGGKYIGFMGDLELQLEIIKDNNRDKDIRTSKKGAYVVEYDKWYYWKYYWCRKWFSTCDCHTITHISVVRSISKYIRQYGHCFDIYCGIHDKISVMA